MTTATELATRAMTRVHYAERGQFDNPTCGEIRGAMTMVYKWGKVTCRNCLEHRPKNWRSRE